MRFCAFVAVLAACVFAPLVNGDPPPLLADALARWEKGRQDLAFTQTTRGLNDDQSVDYVRVERYDPSLPDERRWRLVEINGKPPTEEQRKDIEDKRNRKPRKHAGNPPGHYLDLENARLVRETDETAHFEVGINPDVARFVTLDKLLILIAVDKETKRIDHVSALLREPIRIALGLAKVVDVDLDVQFQEPPDGPPPALEMSDDSSARVMMSKFGNPVEFTWSDFKEVPAYRSPDESGDE